MKKTFLLTVVLSVIGILLSCNSLEYTAAPVLGKPHSFVIDSSEADDDPEDNIRLYNQTTKTGISFNVYVHDLKADKWIVYGTGNLKGPGDASFVTSDLSGDLEDYRYFAIEALDGKDYSYSFYVKSDDLHITITDRKK